MKRSKEIGKPAPSADCVITSVVTPAQYASGSRASRATRMESTAATAVRTEWISTGQTGPSVNLAHAAPQVFPMLDFFSLGKVRATLAHFAGGFCVSSKRPATALVMDELDERRADAAANQRTDDRNERIAPIRFTLAGNGQNEMRQARPKVASGVDGVSRGTAEAESQAPHQHAPQIRTVAGHQSRWRDGRGPE